MNEDLRVLLRIVKRWFGELSPKLKRALISALVILIPIISYQQGAGLLLEPYLLKPLFMLRGERPTPSSVSIAEIDEQAYDLIKKPSGSLYPRAKVAQAISAIMDAGAKVVFVDGIFGLAGETPKDDLALAATLEKYPVVIGSFTHKKSRGSLSGEEKEIVKENEPIELFSSKAKFVMQLAVKPFPDTAVRFISLSKAEVPQVEPLRTLVDKNIKAPGPFDFINYIGPPASIPSISIAELINNNPSFDSAYFKDRVVWLGYVAALGTGLDDGKDTFQVPVASQLMNGIEIQATITENLLHGSFIRRMPISLEIIVLNFVSFLLSYFVLAFRPVVAAAVTLGSGACWFALSLYLFSYWNFFLPALTILLFVIPVVILCAALKLGSGEEQLSTTV